MGQFFPTAQAFIEKYGFAKYLDGNSQELDDRLWSDVHKDAFGFRPREAWHYPEPNKISECCEILYGLISQQIDMQNRAKLVNLFKLENRITVARARDNLSYRDALLRVARAQDAYLVHDEAGPNGGALDEGQFCYEFGLDYALEAQFRHIVKGELA